jgi:hypothetical protein
VRNKACYYYIDPFTSLENTERERKVEPSILRVERYLQGSGFFHSLASFSVSRSTDDKTHSK